MLARHNDPATSHMAAQMAIVFIEDHCSRILAALEDGPLGVDGIAKRIGLSPHQVGKRMGELERRGLVRLTGRTVPSASGRAQREWAA